MRGVGYDVDYLVYQISRELGLTQDWPVAIVGIGNLGHALADYGGFATRGFSVVALFDHDKPVVGEEIAGLTVHSIDDLESVVRSAGVAIGVVATPAAAAQDVCDRLVAAGRAQRAELRAVRAVRARRRRRPQGRPVDRAADPRLPRAAPGRRRGDRAHRLGIGRAPMSLLVVGLSHRTSQLALLERVALDPAAARELSCRLPWPASTSARS